MSPFVNLTECFLPSAEPWPDVHSVQWMPTRRLHWQEVASEHQSSQSFPFTFGAASSRRQATVTAFFEGVVPRLKTASEPIPNTTHHLSATAGGGVSSFTVAQPSAPQAKGPPGTMKGWPEGDEKKDDQGLAPGECEASVAKQKADASEPKDDREREANAIPQYDPETREKIPEPKADDVCKLQKRTKPYYDDPPEDPKKVYQIEPGQRGPVRPHKDFAGGYAKIMASLKVGSKAKIDHVLSEEGQDLNGQMCRIEGRDDATDKFLVQAEDGTKAKLGGENLTPQLEDDEAAAKTFADSVGPKKPGLTN